MNPTWYIIPEVYNECTSSLRISGIPTPRPWGVVYEGGIQTSQSKPIWSPSRSVDFELEIGVYLSKTLPTGQVLNIKTTKEYIFGFVILNDWSARDIQGFEMAPLGPFHSKGFCTTISPWIVTLDTLEAVEQ
jgi:fumarylacetoacetase